MSHDGTYMAATLEDSARRGAYGEPMPLAYVYGHERACWGDGERVIAAGRHTIRFEAEGISSYGRDYATEARARVAVETALGLRSPEPVRHCGMCAAYGLVTVTRSRREWLDTSVAGGRWLPICRQCYRELRAAYASGAQGPEHLRATGRVKDTIADMTWIEIKAARMAALREVTR